MSFYEWKLLDLGNNFKVQIAINISILGIFQIFKLKYKLELMNFISLVGFKFLKIILWRNFRSRIRNNKFPKYTRMAYFEIYSYNFLCRKVKNTSMRQFSTPFEATLD